MQVTTQTTTEKFISSLGDKLIEINDVSSILGIDKSLNDTKIIENSNCLTAREDRGISNRKSEGTAVLELLGNVNPSGKGMNGSVYSYNGLAPTVTTNKGEGNKILDTKNIRIRKLTPLECFRLMAFTDEDFHAVEDAGISNSQMHKQTGNSIVVDVLYYILRELYIAMPYLFDDLRLSSYFSGIGAFEKALDKLFEDINSGNFTNPQGVTSACGDIRNICIDDTQGFDGVGCYNGYVPTLRSQRSGLKVIEVPGYDKDFLCMRYQRTEYAKQIRKDYEAGKIKERRCNMREYTVKEYGCCNTLTTVQKDNYILEVTRG